MTDEETPVTTVDEEISPEDLSGMSEEEIRAKIEEHVRRQKVSDVLVQFMASLSNLAYMKMGLTDDTQDIRDTGQARLAIDSFKALLDTAGDRLEEQDRNALSGALASMQMTFAKVVSTNKNASGPAAAASENPESGEKNPEE